LRSSDSPGGVLLRTFPYEAVVGEEFGTTGSASRTWIVDPIDGTSFFVGPTGTGGYILQLQRGDQIDSGSSRRLRLGCVGGRSADRLCPVPTTLGPLEPPDLPLGVPVNPPIVGAAVERVCADGVAELLVLQRCCWVQEAIDNETTDIAALRESLEDVRRWIDEWDVWCVRLGGRLIGAVRAHLELDHWEIGRLMVAPDYSGRGLGRWLLNFAEDQAPDGATQCALFTGSRSSRNISIYERAGYVRTSPTGATPPGIVHLVKHRTQTIRSDVARRLT
jgi:GNAT superfamily N-acetyltransferase